MSTYKRINVHLNKKEAETLLKLCEEEESSQSYIMKKALNFYDQSQKHTKDLEKDKNNHGKD